MKSSNISNDAGVDRAAVNRENSLHSTGPRTEAGKQRTRLNALRHGLTGQTIVLPSEDLAAYQTFTKRFFDDLRPKGVLEQELVQTLADCKWRINRASAMANTLESLGIVEAAYPTAPDPPEAAAALAAARAFCENTRAIATLSMYEQRLSRQFEKALSQFRELEAERRETERQQMLEAARLLQVQKDKKLPYSPADDGFVFSTEEIEAYLARKERKDEASRAHYLRNVGGLFPEMAQDARRFAASGSYGLAATPRP